MTKVTLTPTKGGILSRTQLDNNFQKIEDALNNDVLYRKNPQGEANSMNNELDMNGYRIFNLPDAINATEPLTLGQAQGISQEVVSSGPSYSNPEATLNPKRDLTQFAQTDTPVVVVMGDSISTEAPTITLNEIDSQWGIIQRRLTQDNPDLDITFENRAIGGSTWTNANPATNLADTGLTLPDWVNDGGVQPWLDYVEALNPDVLLLAWGMNDRQNFVTVQFRAVIEAIQAWTKVPDIVFITNMRPNSQATDVPSIGDPVAQQGRDFVAGYIRTWAQYNGQAMIDLNRFQNILVGGYDPTISRFERISASRLDVTTPYTVDAENQCAAFGWDISVTDQSATFWDSPLKVALSPYSPDFPNSESFLEISDDGGFLKYEFVDVDDVKGRYLSATTTIATPITGADFQLTLFVKSGFINIELDGETIYEGRIRRHGGKFQPRLEFVSGKSESMSVFFYQGTYNNYIPTVTEDQMWGFDGEGGNKGGNTLNHPTSEGAAKVMWPLFKATDFRQPVVTEGNTDFTGTTERKAGIRKANPKGTLHIGDGANSDQPNTNANQLVIEDASNAGMSLLTNNTGVARIFFGDEDADNAGGLTYVHSTDTGALVANGTDAISFTDTRTTFADEIRFKAEDGIAGVNASNRSMQFTLVSDTTLRIYVRGNDGTTRSVDLTLA